MTCSPLYGFFFALVLHQLETNKVLGFWIAWVPGAAVFPVRISSLCFSLHLKYIWAAPGNKGGKGVKGQACTQNQLGEGPGGVRRRPGASGGIKLLKRTRRQKVQLSAAFLFSACFFLFFSLLGKISFLTFVVFALDFVFTRQLFCFLFFFFCLGDTTSCCNSEKKRKKKHIWGLRSGFYFLCLTVSCCCACSEEPELQQPQCEHAQWGGWEGDDMAVSTQLGLLLWKNFTYRRRQTVSGPAYNNWAFFSFSQQF